VTAVFAPNVVVAVVLVEVLTGDDVEFQVDGLTKTC
jgi:hypothetical protein